jgi:hypothetical protein
VGGRPPAAREVAETVDGGGAVPVPGDRHLFADSGLAVYEEQASAHLKEHVLAFLKNAD